MGLPASAGSSRRTRPRSPTPAGVAVLILACVLLTACGGEHPSGVAGRVVWRNLFGDTVGLAEAWVVARPVGDADMKRTVRSGADGRYTLPLEAGRYDVSIYADFGEGMPTWTGEVGVRHGTTTGLPTCRSSNPATLRAGVERRLRELTRAEADRLGLVRHSANVSVLGSHAALATGVFGPLPSLAPDRRVYVVVLTGRPGAGSPDGPAVAALRGGGYVALLVTAGDLAVRARIVSPAPWSRAAGAALRTPGVNGFLAN
jgi:hypothetical protein